MASSSSRARLAALFLVALALVCSCRRAGPAEREAFKTHAEPVLLWLDEQKEAHGRYPETLPAARSAELDAYPAFVYRVFDSGEDFELAFGDYLRDGFTLSWDSDRREWYLDT